MNRQCAIALTLFALAFVAVFTALCGFAYPLAVTAVAKLAFSSQAEGSLVRRPANSKDNAWVGSRQIGQRFESPRYFWGRESGAGAKGWDATASSGRNLGPSNPALLDVVAGRVRQIRAAHPEQRDVPIPVDLATASASGLDPDVSPAAAHFQVERVARVRGLPVDVVRTLVEAAIEPPQWGFLGTARVNVLALNLSLDALDATNASASNAAQLGRR